MSIFDKLSKEFESEENIKDDKIYDICNNCKKQNTLRISNDLDNSSPICIECGYQESYSSDIDYGIFEDTDKDSSYGGVHSSLLKITGSKVSVKGKNNMFFQRMQTWCYDYEDRSRCKVYTKYDNIGVKLDNFSIVSEKAKFIYKELDENQDDVLRGPNRIALQAVCYHKASQQLNLGLSYSEIGKAFGINNTKKITEAMSKFNMTIKKTKYKNIGSNITIDEFMRSILLQKYTKKLLDKYDINSIYKLKYISDINLEKVIGMNKDEILRLRTELNKRINDEHIKLLRYLEKIGIKAKKDDDSYTHLAKISLCILDVISQAIKSGSIEKISNSTPDTLAIAAIYIMLQRFDIKLDVDKALYCYNKEWLNCPKEKNDKEEKKKKRKSNPKTVYNKKLLTLLQLVSSRAHNTIKNTAKNLLKSEIINSWLDVALQDIKKEDIVFEESTLHVPIQIKL